MDLTGGPVPAGIDRLEGVFGVDADAGGGYVCGLKSCLTLAVVTLARVRKPKQHLSRSQPNNRNKNSGKNPIKISANHATKQQQASALINRGKLQEAEEIYKDMIAAGVSNHIIYGRLAALCAMQDKVDESIKLIRHPQSRAELSGSVH